MKFGAFFLNQSPEMRPAEEVYARTVDMAAFADQLGFDSVWLAEHHFSSYGYCPNPLLMAVKLAERTKKARIGIGVMVVPFYHPLRLAEEIGMADQLTEGRLDLGVGRGYQPYEFNRFGVPIEENFERFNEYMEIVTRCLSGEGLAYDGKYFQFPTTWTFPGALQKPHPPFWHAGSSPTSMTLSGQRGLPHHLLRGDGESEEQQPDLPGVAGGQRLGREGVHDPETHLRFARPGGGCGAVRERDVRAPDGGQPAGGEGAGDWGSGVR